MTRYIDVRATHRLIGSNFPEGVPSLVKSLDEFLAHLVKQGEHFPEQLLAHNLSGKRNRAMCELARIDADLQFTYTSSQRHLDRTVKDYRIHKQYARIKEEQRVVLHLLIRYPNRTSWAIQVPLQALIKGFGDPEEGYQCYSHSITLLGDNGPISGEQNYYCGITSRNWLKRMSEHLAEVRSGSNKTFHKAWREYQGRSDVMLGSELVVLNHSFDAAMSWEEWIVDRYIGENRTLNMIPGGKKGLQVLHKFGLIGRTDKISLEEREQALTEYARRHPRSGVPNLLIAELWKDDSFYTKVIEGRQDTLSREQVLRIRHLAGLGCGPELIAQDVGARNVDQVRRVMAGKTYSRMS